MWHIYDLPYKWLKLSNYFEAALQGISLFWKTNISGEIKLIVYSPNYQSQHRAIVTSLQLLSGPSTPSLEEFQKQVDMAFHSIF